MKMKNFNVPVSTFFRMEASAVMCYSPDTPGSTLPTFGSDPVGGYDDDNPYFG